MYPGKEGYNPYGQAGGQQPQQYGSPAGYYGAPGMPQGMAQPMGAPGGYPQGMPPTGFGAGGAPGGMPQGAGGYQQSYPGGVPAGYQPPGYQDPKLAVAPGGYGQQQYPMGQGAGPAKPDPSYQQQPPPGYQQQYPMGQGAGPAKPDPSYQQQPPPGYQQQMPPGYQQQVPQGGYQQQIPQGGYQPPAGYQQGYPQQQAASASAGMFQQVQQPQAYQGGAGAGGGTGAGGVAGAGAGAVASQPIIKPGQIDTNNRNLRYNQQMIWFQFNSTRILVFNFSDKQWYDKPNYANYKFNEYFRVSQLPDHSCILTGGSNSQGHNTNITLHYHEGNIKARRGMNTPRRAHSSLYFNEFVYVFGGLNEKGFLTACERYNFMSDVWENIAPMSLPRTLTSVCGFNNDSIFIFGGFNENMNKELDLIERYDIPTGKMNVCGYKLVNRLQNPFVIQINDQEILLVGGYNDDIGDSSEVYLINVFKGEFTPRTGINDRGWGVYPPIYLGNKFYYFMTGEDDKAPDAIEHEL